MYVSSFPIRSIGLCDRFVLALLLASTEQIAAALAWNTEAGSRFAFNPSTLREALVVRPKFCNGVKGYDGVDRRLRTAFLVDCAKRHRAHDGLRTVVRLRPLYIWIDEVKKVLDFFYKNFFLKRA